MQIGGRSMIFMRGKRGAHKFMHAYYGSAKNVLHKEEGQENLNMASLHLHQPPPPTNNNNRSLKT